ncbi:MAG: hypothetical protein MHM6MM_000915 [Cercozoa sp. M6MM]
MSDFELPAAQVTWRKEYAVVVLVGDDNLPDKFRRLAVPFDDLDHMETLPEPLPACIKAICMHADAAQLEQFQVGEEKRPESKYSAALPQLSNNDGSKNVPMDSSTWVCQETGYTGDNLWLNLSTGHIGSGRRQWDGSGGTDGALTHYENTGRQYPLVVKLGTVNPLGADVYSYAKDEDRMVTIPRERLAQLLAHWGIDMSQMRRTSKTMDELEVALNSNWQFGRIVEKGIRKQPVAGPFLIGLGNTGNSCYFNSVMQILLSIPEVRAKYADQPVDVTGEPHMDVEVQLGKLFRAVGSEFAQHALVSTEETDGENLPLRLTEELPLGEKLWRTPKEKDSNDTWVQPFDTAVVPLLLRQIIGRGHDEFQTNLQQDAHHYWEHLLEFLDRDQQRRAGRSEAHLVSSLFRFDMQQRLQCAQSQQVRYSQTKDLPSLSLPIPLNKSKRLETAEETANPTDSSDRQVLFEDCLSEFAAVADIADFRSPVTQQLGLAQQTQRMTQFPPYLCIHLQRYVLDETTWQPRKIGAVVEMPKQLDLTALRSHRKPDDEVLLPAGGGAEQRPNANPNIVQALQGMGFSENAAVRAALAVDNASADAAATWLFSHLEDPDLNDPLPSVSSASAAVSDESVMMLHSMGFPAPHCRVALQQCAGDANRAVEWLFSHTEELQAGVYDNDAGRMTDEPQQQQQDEGVDNKDAPQYELFGIVSHLGNNTAHGHYVAHVRDPATQQWHLFDDERVFESQQPPFGLGFCYFYRRVNASNELA